MTGLRIRHTAQFRKDARKLHKQGKDFAILEREVLQPLQQGQQLDRKYRDHALAGDFARYRECHIRADWLLIYEITEDAIVLWRTGSHADLFK